MSAGRRSITVGLIGALVFFGAAGVYLAAATPAYQNDESAHVGYALSLRQGKLPSIFTPTPSEGGRSKIDVAMSRPRPYSRSNVHTANNPPFPYLASLPLVEASIRSGTPGGALFGLRLFDVFGGIAGVAFAYLLGRELGGQNPFAGLVTAGLLSGTIAIASSVCLAAIDGPAFAATTGATWALARFARTRADIDALLVGLLCAAAAAVRPMSVPFALVVGALALVLALAAHGWRRAVPLAIRLGAPTLLLTGWFYILNIARYGDPTGLAGKLDQQGITDPGAQSIWQVLSGPEPLIRPLPYIITRAYGADFFFIEAGRRDYLITVVAVLVLAGAVAISLRSSRSGNQRLASQVAPAPAWLSVAVLAATPVLVTAQHIASGGGGQPRYLLPILPILAAAAAVVTRHISRWISLLTVGAFAVAQVVRIHTAGDLRGGGGFLTPPPLRGDLVGQPLQVLSFAAAIGGAIALIATLVLMARSDAAKPFTDPPPADRRSTEHRRLSGQR